MQLKNLDIVYKQQNSDTLVRAVKGFNYDFHKGKTYAIIGPSGCGKSSLLLAMAGLLKPTSGTVKWMGESIVEPHPSISLILQDYGLFPWKTVWENACLGLVLRNQLDAKGKEKVKGILEYLGLFQYLDRFPKELSGGQQQRVAIARALATDPQLLLMDEPLSALDALTRESMQELLVNIWKREAITMIIVTHNIEEAVYLGQEILVMTDLPGQIEHVFENPHVGNAQFRSSPEYYKFCASIRAKLNAKGVGNL
ncbi:NitT/TauT family transport system ATP-binding protein [Desulfitispora alkaliphila]|uniref:ABC transporter ATP-binding protein n=1 Tax=Desulfitispora alkaliphila TaxID=622674 RepID=UPI003D25538F